MISDADRSLPATETRPATNETVLPTSTSVKQVATSDAAMRSIIVNELLSYIAYYRNRATGDALRSVTVKFFTNDEIRDAKAALAEKFKTTIGDNALWTERRDTIVRPAHEAELDDVIALPKYGPEDLNIGSIIDRHQKLDITVRNLSRELEQLKQATSEVPDCYTSNTATFESAIAEIQKRIDEFNTSVSSRIDFLNSVRG